MFGDRWWWLFLLNAFSEYLFVPLPLTLILAVIVCRRDVTIGFVVTCVIGCFLYGALILPPVPLHHTPGPQITVMTSNIFGNNTDVPAVLEAIQAADVDIVAIQELNPQIAEGIQRDLAEMYPYQELVPVVGVKGVGVISRYPMQPMGIEIEGRWVGGPQVLEVEWEGEKIIVINVHAIPPGPLTPQNLEYSIRERERQLGVLLEFVESRTEPVIVLGDLNVTAQNTAYSLMSTRLQDAWVEGGWGMGHTFPGADLGGCSGGDKRALWTIWLLRLDYIFCSEQWEVERAWTGPWDGVSDHQPVRAKLVLSKR